jgi:adenosyl cobinamide kinase/adenosyl cobinamide phosphate guanylyltransferase
MITLVLGGARSGKSSVAESLALRSRGAVLYLATGQATDDEMRARIDAHRAARDERFETVEAGRDLVAVLSAHVDQPALVDSLGTWVAAHEDFAVDADALCAALTARRASTVLVSDEVGLGVHPSSDAGRRFRDVLGELNQAVAAVADSVVLVVAGRVLPLVDLDPSEPAR